ncbi:MAG TPA: hypothetical protein VIV06_02890 [Candidatus Limnocylindrales bacterium]
MFATQLARQFATPARFGVRLAQLALWLALAAMFAGPIPVVAVIGVAVAISAFDPRSWRELDPSVWLRHACEMLVAMYGGMLAFHGLVIPVVDGVIGSAPGGLRYVAMVASMVLSMVAIMRLERHSWRMAGEMTVAMVAPIVGCFALVGLGLSNSTPLLAWLTPASVYAAAHDGMVLGMLVPMIVRRAMYGIAGPARNDHGLEAMAAA